MRPWQGDAMQQKHVTEISKTVMAVFGASLCVESANIVFQQVASVTAFQSTKPNMPVPSVAWQCRLGTWMIWLSGWRGRGCRAACCCRLCHSAICKVHSEAFSLHIGVENALLTHQTDGRRFRVSARLTRMDTSMLPGFLPERIIAAFQGNRRRDPTRYATAVYCWMYIR